MTNKRNSTAYIFIFSGIISSFGPFVTDFYLPALPALADYFQSTTSRIQLSLTLSMIGLGIGQILIGPLSDKYERKIPLQGSLLLFCLTSAGCIFATGIQGFFFFRFLQGIAGAGGVVISRAIATDLYQGKALSRFFALLSSIQGLAPIFAPVLGGILLQTTPWKGIFWILLGLGILLFLCSFAFKESLPVSRRAAGKFRQAFRPYGPTLKNKTFMFFTLTQAFAMGCMFTYISASPFIFQNHFHLSSLTYSLCFGINALGIMGGSLLSNRFPSPRKALWTGVCGLFALSLSCAAILVWGNSWILLELSFLFFLIFLGLILPSSTVLALDTERQHSGIASAILGFMGFLIGGILSPVTGIGNMRYTSGMIFILCCLCAIFCAKTALQSGQVPAGSIPVPRRNKE